MKTQWSVCQRFPSCSVSPPTATHPLATSGDVVVKSFALWHFLVASSRLSIGFFILADPLVGWSSNPLASAVMLLLASWPPPCFLAWHLDTAVAAAAALHVLPRSPCSSPSTRVVRRRSAGSSRLPACSSRLVSFSVFSLFLASPLLHPAPHRVSLFLGYFQPIAQSGCPAVPRAAPNQHQQRDQAGGPHGSVSDPLCVWSHMRSASLHSVCVRVLVILQDGGMTARRSDRQRSGTAGGTALLWQSLHN